MIYEALGGTNLRVCLVTLQGHGRFEITQTKYRLTEEQKQEEGEKLFDFCAECVKSFVETNTEKDGQCSLSLHGWIYSLSSNLLSLIIQMIHSKFTKHQ